MKKSSCTTTECQYKLADLPLTCRETFEKFEHELNRQGYWNIALVAYQKED